MSEIENTPSPSGPPKRSKLILESRTVINAAGMLFNIAAGKLKASKANQDQPPIILLPGFGSDCRYLKPLSKFLNRHGYKTEDWGLGFNFAGQNLRHKLTDISDKWDITPNHGYDPETYRGEGGVPYLCDLATQKILKRATELDSQVILLGWSLGGYIAREVARDLPNQVAHVITLGAPVIGGPKYTAAARYFSRKGFDLDWIEIESEKRNSKPIQQAITAIYSKSDAIVDWRATIDKINPNVEHIEVSAAHLGMGFSQKVWACILTALATNEV
ncbi:alpha/beta hydrolase [Arenicella sp.]|nr:alpha/beta hydrolase [Arenicella sp.]